VEVDGRRRLDLNKEMIGSGFGKIFKIALRLDDHHVYLQRLRGRAAHRVHDRRAEGDIRHEPAIHDVDMHPIGAGLINGANLFSKPPQIGR